MNISFGTDGWRGIIAQDFTSDNLKKVIRAIANWLYWPGRGELDIYKAVKENGKSILQDPGNGVVIGYDTRFMSSYFAKLAAEELISCGIPVYLSKTHTSSPALTHAVLEKQAAAGIIITASHNAPHYNGIKYKAEYGGAATSEMTWEIEKLLNTTERFYPFTNGNLPTIQEFSPDKNYLKDICELVDMERIANSRFKIISDPLYGAAIGLMERIFKQIGSYIEEIRNEENPNFGGYDPEPIGKNIAPLVEKVLRSQADIGFSFDGDGDTLGIVDSLGSFIQPHEIFALVLWHLVENRKWTGGIATTFATSRLTKSMAEHYKLPLYETAVGFKHITNLMLINDILIGGEESGGIGIKNSIPDKNAPLIALMALEAMSYAGKGIDEIINELSYNFGTYYFHRTDICFETNEEKEEVMNRLCKKNIKSFDGTKIKDIFTLDGIKYILDDNSWILFRASGTESIFRIYVEATSHQKANRILAECEEITSQLLN